MVCQIPKQVPRAWANYMNERERKLLVAVLERMEENLHCKINSEIGDRNTQTETFDYLIEGIKHVDEILGSVESVGDNEELLLEDLSYDSFKWVANEIFGKGFGDEVEGLSFVNEIAEEQGIDDDTFNSLAKALLLIKKM